MSAGTRKKSKRALSPAATSTVTENAPPATATGTSVWLSASGLPPELFVDQISMDIQTVTSKRKKELSEIEGESASSSPLTVTESAVETKTFCFKDQNFVHSSKGIGGSKRARVWKTLKQVIATEKALPWAEEDVTYASIEAPPSFKPAKKYSDLSGLPARYTDPHTKLRYATPEEFARVRVLPSDIVSGYLNLRKANTVVP